MIIKSMTRKDKQSYSQLVNYITQEAKIGNDNPLIFSYNIESVDPKSAAKEMQDNYAYRKRIREDENALMHYVLSFHKDDTPVLGREVLSDVMNEFMEEFSPNGMGYGAVHNDQEHLHCHMVLTANEIESDKLIYKKRYLNQEQKERPAEERSYKERTFEESKNRIREFARERAKQYAIQKQMAKEYQEHGLFHSYNEKYRTHNRNGKQKSKDRLDNQRRRNGRGTQQQKNRKGTILNILTTDTLDALRSGGSFIGFARKLQEKGYTLYRTKRGTINGIMYEGKKYRFTTTLLPDAERKVLNEMRRTYEQIEQTSGKQREKNRNYERG